MGERILKFLKFWIALLTLWSAANSAAQQHSEVSFRLIDGWAMIVDGTLAGVPHQKMLIDTGAVPSVINARVAKRIGLSGSASELSLMNRSIAVERVHVPEVGLGPLSATVLDMVSVDLEKLEQALATRIDAVIGLDFLAQRNFSLDYQHKRLIIGEDSISSGAITFEIEHEAGGTYILIPMECGGQRLRILLDTGTRDFLLFKSRMRGGLQRLPARGQRANFNPAGQDQLTEVEIAFVRAGTLFREKQKAFVWATPEKKSETSTACLGRPRLALPWSDSTSTGIPCRLRLGAKAAPSMSRPTPLFRIRSRRSSRGTHTRVGTIHANRFRDPSVSQSIVIMTRWHPTAGSSLHLKGSTAAGKARRSRNWRAR